MKRPEHIVEATAIGAESYSLQNFEQLPKDASIAEQLQALDADRRWQELHHTEVVLRIGRLKRDIERGGVG